MDAQEFRRRLEIIADRCNRANVYADLVPLGIEFQRYKGARGAAHRVTLLEIEEVADVEFIINGAFAALDHKLRADEERTDG